MAISAYLISLSLIGQPVADDRECPPDSGVVELQDAADAALEYIAQKKKVETQQAQPLSSAPPALKVPKSENIEVVSEKQKMDKPVGAQAADLNDPNCPGGSGGKCLLFSVSKKSETSIKDLAKCTGLKGKALVLCQGEDEGAFKAEVFDVATQSRTDITDANHQVAAKEIFERLKAEIGAEESDIVSAVVSQSPKEGKSDPYAYAVDASTNKVTRLNLNTNEKKQIELPIERAANEKVEFVSDSKLKVGDKEIDIESAFDNAPPTSSYAARSKEFDSESFLKWLHELNSSLAETAKQGSAKPFSFMRNGKNPSRDFSGSVFATNDSLYVPYQTSPTSFSVLKFKHKESKGAGTPSEKPSFLRRLSEMESFTNSVGPSPSSNLSDASKRLALGNPENGSSNAGVGRSSVGSEAQRANGLSSVSEFAQTTKLQSNESQDLIRRMDKSIKGLVKSLNPNFETNLPTLPSLQLAADKSQAVGAIEKSALKTAYDFAFSLPKRVRVLLSFVGSFDYSPFENEPKKKNSSNDYTVDGILPERRRKLTEEMLFS